MPRKISILILGSKEYPMGTNKGDDPIPSGGIETIISNLAPELSRKCKVIVITRKFSNTEWHETDDVEVYRVPWIKGKYFRTPSFILFSSILTFYLLLKGRVDIIYAQGVIAALPALFMARLFKKPIVCRPHGSGAPQWTFPINEIMYYARKFVFSRCDMLIFNSEEEKNNLSKNLRLDFNRYQIIMPSIKIEGVSARELRQELGLNNELIISYVGRLHPIKGVHHLIEAVSGVEEDFKVLIVGDGPQREELKNLVKKRGLENKILFLGFRRDIPKILASTDIFVLPSLSEGLPRALLEAMAAGKACVVTDIGLPVENHKTAIVVPPGDTKELRKAIELLLKDDRLRKSLGENARRFIDEKCSVENEIKKHLEVFKKLIIQNVTYKDSRLLFA